MARINSQLDALPTPRTVNDVRAVMRRAFPPPSVLNVGPDGPAIFVQAWLDLNCTQGAVQVTAHGAASLHLVATDSPECGA